jgi:transposase
MGDGAVMGRQDEPERLFYKFSLERHVPVDHLLRQIDAVLDLSTIRRALAPYYAAGGRPSIDPELMIRMLLVGYAFAIRSERRLCDEVHLNLAYRWFCRLGLEGDVPDHSTFSKNRHGRFRESDLFRQLFEQVVRMCMQAGLVGGEGFAIDASVIEADAGLGRKASKLAFAYGTNYLIDNKLAIIVDVEASPARWQAEVAATKTMLQRTKLSFGLHPQRLAADTAYGSGLMIAWLMQRGIEPHVPLLDRERQTKGLFTRADFKFDDQANTFTCPGGKTLKSSGLILDDGTIPYRASTVDCGTCLLKPDCTTGAKRIVTRHLFEKERQHVKALRGTDAFERSARERKKVEMLFAHLKRNLGLRRLRLRGLTGAKDEFLLAATVQNLKKLVRLCANAPPIVEKCAA